MRIAPATQADAGEWRALRSALWPDTSQLEHEEDGFEETQGVVYFRKVPGPRG